MRKWTKRDISIMEELWSKGFTGTQIGKVLKRSRSAILGKIHRLGMQRNPTGKRKSEEKSILNPEFKEKILTRLTVRPNEALPKSYQKLKFQRLPNAKLLFGAGKELIDLKSNECRWPVTYGKKHRFCAAPRYNGKPYCEEHYNCSIRAGSKKKKFNTKNSFWYR